MLAKEIEHLCWVLRDRASERANFVLLFQNHSGYLSSFVFTHMLEPACQHLPEQASWTLSVRGT